MTYVENEAPGALIFKADVHLSPLSTTWHLTELQTFFDLYNIEQVDFMLSVYSTSLGAATSLLKCCKLDVVLLGGR